MFPSLLFVSLTVTNCQNGFCFTFDEEITAQAGLCVVIPCSFITRDGYTSEHMVWRKCELSQQRCADSDVIFHTEDVGKV